MKSIKTSLLILIIFMINGCATVSIIKDGLSTKKSTTDFVFDDEIIAIGQPQDSQKTVQTGKLLALVGLNNTYVISDGAEEIEEISNELDGNLVQINESSPAITMYVNSGKDEFENSIQYISGQINVSYRKKISELSENEKFSLNKMKFSIDENSISKRISIAGIVYPKAKNLDEIRSKFSRSRPVRFYKTTYQTSPKIDKYMLLTFGVAFDVATSPIQIPLWIYILNNFHLRL